MPDASASPLNRIYPPAENAPRVATEDAYAELEFNSGASDDRPYVIVNMVATADGQGRHEGDTSDLGDAADATLFATLRQRVDCVMAGPRTVGIENYKAPGAKDETQAVRLRAGLAARPVFATATRSGRLPSDAPLFQDPELEVVVFSEAELAIDDIAAQIRHVRTEEPRHMLAALRRDFGVRSVLLEGGPHINTPFFAGELIDELFLTIAPLLIGGAEQFPIIAGDLPQPQNLHLITALSGDEHLFLRYRVD